MPLIKRRVRVAGEIPTASMADIAFLLLIFFLVTTVFKEEKGLPIVLPAPSEMVEVAPTDVLHLAVRADGRVEMRRGESAEVEVVEPDAVGALWQAAAGANPRLVAAVQTDPGAAYQRMVAVLDALQRAGAERISLEMAEAK